MYFAIVELLEQIENDHELFEKRIELSEDLCFPNLGRSLLPLLNLDTMNYQLFVGGESADGGLTVAVCLYARAFLLENFQTAQRKIFADYS